MVPPMVRSKKRQPRTTISIPTEESSTVRGDQQSPSAVRQHHRQPNRPASQHKGWEKSLPARSTVLAGIYQRCAVASHRAGTGR
jgi:hypothetical protein